MIWGKQEISGLSGELHAVPAVLKKWGLTEECFHLPCLVTPQIVQPSVV